MVKELKPSIVDLAVENAVNWRREASTAKREFAIVISKFTVVTPQLQYCYSNFNTLQRVIVRYTSKKVKYLK